MNRATTINGARRRAIARALWVLALLPAAFACSEDEEPTTALVPRGYGVIEGRISGPDGPLAGGVEIRSTARVADGPLYRASLNTDSSGWFEHPVPYGEYLVFARVLYGPSLPYCAGRRSSADGDTLLVSLAQDRLRLDFDLGGARVTIPVPQGWEGDEPLLEVELENGGRCAVRNRFEMTRTGDRYDAVLNGLPAGRYVVTAIFDYEDVPLPVAPSGSGPDRLMLRSGEWIDVEYEIPPPATIRGRVIGSWPEMVERSGCGGPPQITFVEARDHSSIGHGELNELGEYRLRSFARDSMCVYIAFANRGRWLGGEQFDQATRFFPQPGAELVLPDYVAGGMILQLHIPGDPPPSETYVRCRVYDQAGTAIHTTNSGICSETAGAWILPIFNLTPDTYYLQIVDDDCRRPWAADWYQEAGSIDTATPVTIGPAGDLVELDWQIALGGRISWILSWEGDGATNCAAKLHPASDSTEVLCGPTSRLVDTADSFQGLRDGAYVLEGFVFAEGRWHRYWYPDATRFADAEIVEVRDHEAIDLGVWRLPR